MTLRITPFTPIFQPDKKNGGIKVGTTPPYIPHFVERATFDDLEGVRTIALYGDSVVGPATGATFGAPRRFIDVDISTPTAPVFSSVEFTAMNGNHGSVHVAGTQMHAVASASSLYEILDITNPAAPAVIGNVSDGSTLSGSWDVAVSGSHGYVTIFETGITIVDFSTPASPTVAATFTDATNLPDPGRIQIVGSLAYVPDRTGRFTILDISTPTSPSVVASLADATNLDDAFDVDVVGNYAYIVCQNPTDRITIVDISTPATPSVVGSIQDTTDLDGMRRIKVQGNYAYATRYTPGYLVAVDISIPSAPTVREVVDIAGMTGANDIVTQPGVVAVSSVLSGATPTCLAVYTVPT